MAMKIISNLRVEQLELPRAEGPQCFAACTVRRVLVRAAVADPCLLAESEAVVEFAPKAANPIPEPRSKFAERKRK